MGYNNDMSDQEWEQVNIVSAREEDEIVVLDESVSLPDDLEAVEAAMERLEDENIYSFDQEEQRLLVKELLAVKESVRELEERLSKLENK